MLLVVAVAPMVDVATTLPASAAVVAHPDFNGDGFADLAIGAQGENGGRGVVHVLFGSRSGPRGDGSLVFGQNSGAVPGAAEPGELFGALLATGDLDGDGFDDLVVGAPRDREGRAAGAGTVTVFYGSRTGPRLDGQLLSENVGGTPGTAEPFDQFGNALAIGDFTGDGLDDLAVGVTFDTVGGQTAAGSVRVYPGRAGERLATFGVIMITRSSLGFGPSHAFDAFGASLATLDAGGPRHGLAFGAPGFDVPGTRDAGAVFTARGTDSGLVGTARLLDPTPRLGTEMGWSLAAGDLDEDGVDDVAIGAFRSGGQRGAVIVSALTGSRRAADRVRRITQDTPGVDGTAAPGDAFGYALTIVDDPGGRSYLYVGVPGERVGGKGAAGAVNVFASTPLPGLALDPVFLMTAPSRMVGANYGLQITALDAQGDGGTDVVVGAPGETVGGALGAGAVYAYDSETDRPVRTGSVRITQDTGGVPDHAEPGDFFGATLPFT